MKLSLKQGISLKNFQNFNGISKLEIILWHKVIQELNILSSFIVTIFPFICEKKCQSKYFSKGIIPFRWTYFCCQEILLFALRHFFFLFFASCVVYSGTLCMSYLKSDLQISNNVTMLIFFAEWLTKFRSHKCLTKVCCFCLDW